MATFVVTFRDNSTERIDADDVLTHGDWYELVVYRVVLLVSLRTVPVRRLDRRTVAAMVEVAPDVTPHRRRSL